MVAFMPTMAFAGTEAAKLTDSLDKITVAPLVGYDDDDYDAWDLIPQYRLYKDGSYNVAISTKADGTVNAEVSIEGLVMHYNEYGNNNWGEWVGIYIPVPTATNLVLMESTKTNATCTNTDFYNPVEVEEDDIYCSGTDAYYLPYYWDAGKSEDCLVKKIALLYVGEVYGIINISATNTLNDFIAVDFEVINENEDPEKMTIVVYPEMLSLEIDLPASNTVIASGTTINGGALIPGWLTGRGFDSYEKTYIELGEVMPTLSFASLSNLYKEGQCTLKLNVNGTSTNIFTIAGNGEKIAATLTDMEKIMSLVDEVMIAVEEEMERLYSSEADGFEISTKTYIKFGQDEIRYSPEMIEKVVPSATDIIEKIESNRTATETDLLSKEISSFIDYCNSLIYNDEETEQNIFEVYLELEASPTDAVLPPVGGRLTIDPSLLSENFVKELLDFLDIIINNNIKYENASRTDEYLELDAKQFRAIADYALPLLNDIIGAFSNNGEINISLQTNAYPTVTFDANGGKFSNGKTSESQIVHYLTSYTDLKVPNNPERIGYKFLGWQYASGSNMVYVTDTDVILGNTTYKAAWQRTSYSGGYTEEILKEIKDNEMKALAQGTTVVVRTENVKRGIKVYVQDNDEVAKAKAEGYKVLYDFYRAEGKTAPSSDQYKITKVINKEEPWYLNTAAKKGHKYYYKAVAKIIDEDGNVIATTELTQGLYGCRTR